MKILVNTLAVLFLFVSPMISQDYSPFYADIDDGSKILTNPFTGGFLTPHFSPTDFDGDGDQDLFVFDNNGNVPMIFLYENGEYVYHPEFKQNFAGIVNWALLRDFDGDGVEDIFSSAVFPAGIEIRKGTRNNGQTTYEFMDFPHYPTGNVLHFPFNGSFFNVYVSKEDIPAISDIDGDGDIDIVTFDIGGSVIWYFKNTSVENGFGRDSLLYVLDDLCYGKCMESEFNASLFLSDDPNECSEGFASEVPDDNKATLHSGSTLTSFDFTNNGLQDLLIGDLTSNSLVLAMNGGTNDNAWFTDQDINYPENNVPADLPLMLGSYIVDVDQDGIQDLLVSPNSAGNVENIENVWYYRNESTTGGMSPNLVQRDFLGEDAFETGRETSPTFVDVNADGLLDIIVGTSGEWTSSVATISKMYYLKNVGTLNEPSFIIEDDDWLNFSDFSNVSQVPAPAFGDLDSDQDLDLLVGYSDGFLYYYENNAGPGMPMSFQNPIWKYKDLEVGTKAKPLIYDVDLDGLNDIVIGENNNNTSAEDPTIRGALNFFRNVGTSDNPDFIPEIVNAENNPILGQVNTQTQFSTKASSAPYLVPNGDDYLLFVGSEDGDIFVYDQIKGNHEGVFNLLDSNLGGFLEGIATAPAVADIDNDNFYEILIGNKRGGLSFYNTDFKVDLVNTDEVDKSAVSIYPNPASSMISIEGIDIVDSQIKLYDRQMKIVRKVSDQNYIDLDNLVNGLYFVEIKTKTQHFFERIIKID